MSDEAIASHLDSFIFSSLDLQAVPTPVHITDKCLLEKNLQCLASVHERTQARILLALKAYAQFSLFPLIKRYLQGATSSSLFEARLAYEKLNKEEVHICAPAYPPEDFAELLDYANHVVFNSFNQWYSFRDQIRNSSSKVSPGIRINPEHSEVNTELYDPCAAGSRLGVRIDDFSQADLSGIEGLHFHTLCELGADSLQRTWQVVEKKFGYVLPKLKWINLGGGHHITRPGYDINLLCTVILDIRQKYKNLTVYLEPGEAVVLNSGILVASVLDIISGNKSSLPVAILDTSATAHMPDVLDMPYQPRIFSNGSWASCIETVNSTKPVSSQAKTKQVANQKKFNYRLGGLTCLAGDIIGDYAFSQPLQINQKLLFTDMSHYTMVKNSNFNGIRPPAIAIGNTKTGEVRLIKKFAYTDYKSRLS